MQGEVAQQRPYPTGLRVGSFSRRLDPGPVYSHQAELGGHKKGVDSQQHGDRHQPEEDGHLRPSLPTTVCPARPDLTTARFETVEGSSIP